MSIIKECNREGLILNSCCLYDFNPHFATLGVSLVALMVKNLPAMWETWVRSLGQGRSPGEGNSNPLQYSCLGKPVDRGAYWSSVLGVTKESDMTS